MLTGRGNWDNGGSRRVVDPRRAVDGSSLIEGGFTDFTDRAVLARRRARRRQTVRVAAPLLVPVALALTLGIILAVSSGAPATRVNERVSGTTSTPAAQP
jgi:hypothetical protein